MRTPPALLARASAPLAAAALVFAMGAPAGAEPPADRGGASNGATMVTDDTPRADHAQDAEPDAGDDRHPSGKDRTVEDGGSGTQGRSPSDPDGASNGGPDKPGYAGGVDVGDQDGNNGCGNDDDFEDDNRGNCLGREGAPGQAETPPADVDGDAEQPTEVEDDVDQPEEQETPAVDGSTAVPQVGAGTGAPAPVVSSPTPAAEVLGHSVTRNPTSAAAPQAEVLGSSVTRQLGALAADGTEGAGTLPRTGVALATMALLGLALAGIGTVVTRLSRADAGA